MEQQVLYEWVPMYCPTCHKVGHICREKKEVGINQKKQWVPKDKGKQQEEEAPQRMDKRGEETWIQPKKTNSASIQVGNLYIPTSNAFEDLNITEVGGDHIPTSVT